MEDKKYLDAEGLAHFTSKVMNKLSEKQDTFEIITDEEIAELLELYLDSEDSKEPEEAPQE